MQKEFRQRVNSVIERYDQRNLVLTFKDIRDEADRVVVLEDRGDEGVKRHI